MKKLLGIVVLGLLLSGNSNACEKEDFIKYVSAGKNKCIAIVKNGNINLSNPIIARTRAYSHFIFVLHIPYCGRHKNA